MPPRRPRVRGFVTSIPWFCSSTSLSSSSTSVAWADNSTGVFRIEVFSVLAFLLLRPLNRMTSSSLELSSGSEARSTTNGPAGNGTLTFVVPVFSVSKKNRGASSTCFASLLPDSSESCSLGFVWLSDSSSELSMPAASFSVHFEGSTNPVLWNATGLFLSLVEIPQNSVP